MDLALAGLMIVMLLMVSTPLWSASPSVPPLMLAKEWQQSYNPADYFISEKLDGVRAYWTGSELRSRSGLKINAPAWFIAHLPNTPLDGELWAGRNRFEQVSSLVQQMGVPDDEAWAAVRFMVFDLPSNPAAFEDRYWVLKTLVAELGNPWVQVVSQQAVSNDGELQQQLQQMVEAGGEGLMLKRRASFYQASRSDDMLKLKIHQDGEAIVIGYVAGKGKYEGMTGSLEVRLDNGRVMRLGSGLTDDLRRDPPDKGTRVTYSYNGYTSSGLPRFARFERVRPLE
ncbi:DNA ligase [Oceanobacter mangrovi]|uniref:DNA ligase n=1 Tax=Oceanobacter mangrovi TaxID=2862510 RepID=UPI001FE7DA0A|nr:DNA ligase [Oceanobacter mangrovi]